MSRHRGLQLPVLRDDLIQLRPLGIADIATMLAAFADPWFVRFSDWAPADRDEASVYLAAAERDQLSGVRIEMAIASIHDPVVVLGGASTHGIDPDSGRAAVGYWLTADARGRGVASRAVRLLAGWAFTDLGMARLELRCGPDNQAPERVAQRCGFRPEGLLRAHLPFKGGRRDTMVFGLLPRELT